MWYPVGFIAIFSFMQFIEGNYITPKIVGSKVSINPFVAIVSIISFSMLWGISDMILVIPMVASLKVVFDTNPDLSPYGFLISEPRDKFMRSKARIRLNLWRKIRKSKR